MTLEELYAAEQLRRDNIARYYEGLNKITGEITALQTERTSAAKAGDVDKVMQITDHISDLQRKADAIRETIEETDDDRYFTDEDCIDAANIATKAVIGEITKRNQKIDKMMHELCMESQAVFELYAATRNKRRQAMVFHSQFQGGKTTGFSGLENLPMPPRFDLFATMLTTYIPNDGNNIVNLCFGDPSEV